MKKVKNAFGREERSAQMELTSDGRDLTLNVLNGICSEREGHMCLGSKRRNPPEGNM